MQPALAQDIRQILQAVDLDANSLVLELTESAVMGNPEASGSALMQLRVMGARIAIDDFGTGYSSLAHLRRIPADILKIDQSFVQAIETSRDALEIVGTISSLAHQLGMCVIAEGIESAGQLDLIRSHNCEFGQGFLFSRAVGCEKAAMLLREGLTFTQAPEDPVPVAERSKTEEPSPLQSYPALDTLDGTSITGGRRNFRLRTIYAVCALTVLVLLILGGLFARFNRLTSPPVAFSSPPAATAPLAVDSEPAPIPPSESKAPIKKPSQVPPTRHNPKPQVFIYPVVHDHFWGSCKGDLKITREAVAFISEKEKDSFDFALSVCSCALERDWLAVKSGSKTFRFKSASALTKEENLSQLEEIVQTVSRLRQEPASRKQ
jgi:EAL domain-containing protein (putative c-di-GMP-specific phosphodiesterase class I)